MGAVGVMNIGAAKLAGSKLNKIRSALTDEARCRELFNQHDVDHSGELDTAELARMAQALGSSLTHNELEAAIISLDTDRSGAVSFEEFMVWFRGEGATQ